MNSGNLLIVNHALFFSDLSLRMAGVNYLPKYDLVILDEAHTVEDVAGQHFGLKISEASIRYNLRALYDLKRGRGSLSVHGSCANDAIRDIVDLNDLLDNFFDRIVAWHESTGRNNGRVQQKNVVVNNLSAKLRDLATHIKAMMIPALRKRSRDERTDFRRRQDQRHGRIPSTPSSAKPSPTRSYWFDISPRPKARHPQRRPRQHRRRPRNYLFSQLPSVVMTSHPLHKQLQQPLPVTWASGRTRVLLTLKQSKLAKVHISPIAQNNPEFTQSTSA